MSDFLLSNDKCINQCKKVALRGKKTAKQAHPMRKVRVSLYFGRSFDKHDTAPEAVTLGYIMPDRRKVDDANRKVLGLLL